MQGSFRARRQHGHECPDSRALVGLLGVTRLAAQPIHSKYLSIQHDGACATTPPALGDAAFLHVSRAFLPQNVPLAGLPLSTAVQNLSQKLILRVHANCDHLHQSSRGVPLLAALVWCAPYYMRPAQNQLDSPSQYLAVGKFSSRKLIVHPKTPQTPRHRFEHCSPDARPSSPLQTFRGFKIRAAASENPSGMTAEADVRE